MLRLGSVLFAAWAAQASASVVKTSLRAQAESENESRRLSFETIANYGPRSLVTDHNAIDLDQKFLERELAKETNSGFRNAKAIYRKGGNSKTIALVSLLSPMTQTISATTDMLGFAEDEDEINLTLYKDAAVGSTSLHLRYSAIDVQEYFNQCRVGALTPSDRVTSGCMKGSGEVKIKNGSVTNRYSYSVTADNYNARTLQYFSTTLESKMLDCPNCPYKDAAMFNTYYGQADYGNEFIMAAFDGTKTDFTRGNADFSLWGFVGRAECVKKGTAYMNVFMFALRSFENALDQCGNGDNIGAVHAWDKGVAYYTGSLETQTGLENGLLMHQLADSNCRKAKTCGSQGNLNFGTSRVNLDVLRLTRAGQEEVDAGLCTEARKTKEAIADLMYIPLVQSTLRYAYEIDNGDGGEKTQGEGAVFAAAVLPRVYAADSQAAQVIYDNMRVGATSTNFKTVKEAFETVYKKMNIGCEEAGGIVDTFGTYLSDASPCTSSDDGGGADDDNKIGDDNKTDDDNKVGDDNGSNDDNKMGDDDDGGGSNKAVILGSVLGSISGVLLLGTIGTLMYVRGKGEEAPVFEANTNEQDMD